MRRAIDLIKPFEATNSPLIDTLALLNCLLALGRHATACGARVSLPARPTTLLVSIWWQRVPTHPIWSGCQSHFTHATLLLALRLCCRWQPSTEATTVDEVLAEVIKIDICSIFAISSPPPCRSPTRPRCLCVPCMQLGLGLGLDKSQRGRLVAALDGFAVLGSSPSSLLRDGDALNVQFSGSRVRSGAPAAVLEQPVAKRQRQGGWAAGQEVEEHTSDDDSPWLGSSEIYTGGSGDTNSSSTSSESSSEDSDDSSGEDSSSSSEASSSSSEEEEVEEEEEEGAGAATAGKKPARQEAILQTPVAQGAGAPPVRPTLSLWDAQRAGSPAA